MPTYAITNQTELSGNFAITSPNDSGVVTAFQVNPKSITIYNISCVLPAGLTNYVIGIGSVYAPSQFAYTSNLFILNNVMYQKCTYTGVVGSSRIISTNFSTPTAASNNGFSSYPDVMPNILYLYLCSTSNTTRTIPYTITIVEATIC